MSKKREKLEVIFDMLNAIKQKGGTIKPTHLLYKSNLSHQMMKVYVDELKTSEMLEEIEEKGKKMFTLTDKGYKFLQEYDRIRSFTESFGL